MGGHQTGKWNIASFGSITTFRSIYLVTLQRVRKCFGKDHLVVFLPRMVEATRPG